MPVNYLKSKIYKLVCDNNEAVWIGSTTKSLCQRMAQHRDTYKKHLSGTAKRCPSFQILNGTNARIELIEGFPCSNKDELNKRLHETIRNYPTAINGKVKEQEHKEPEAKTTEYDLSELHTDDEEMITNETAE